MHVLYRLKPFQAKLLGVRRSQWGSNPQDSLLEAELQQKGLFEDLIPMAAQADLVVLTCAVTDETRGMINSKFLQACKPGIRIINVARGECTALVIAPLNCPRPSVLLQMSV